MPASSSAIRAGQAFIEMTLRDSQLRKGLARIEARLNAVGGAFRRWGRATAAAGGAVVAAFGGAAAVFANAGSRLADMSARTGLSAENLSSLSYAAEQSGASLETVELALRQMQKKGIDPTRFDELARQIAAIEDPTQRAQAAMDLWGRRAGPALLPMIATLDQARAAAHRLGLVMRNEDAAAADALGDALDTAWAQLKRVVETIGAAVAGPLTTFLAWTQGALANAIRWANENRPLVTTVLAVAGGVAVAGGALFTLGVAIQAAAFAAGGLSTAIGVVGALVSAVVSPFGLVVAAIAGVVAAFATLTETGQAVVQNLLTWFGELADFAGETFGAIGTALAAGDIQAAADVLWAALKVIWLQGTGALRSIWDEAKGWYVAAWTTVASKLGQGWGLLQTAWAELTAGLKNAWASFSAFVRSAWSTAQNWVTQNVLKLQKLITETLTGEEFDISVEAAVADAENAARQQEIAAGESQAIAAANAQRDKTLADVESFQSAFESELAAARNEQEADSRARLEQAQKDLADARNGWSAATRQANSLSGRKISPAVAAAGQNLSAAGAKTASVGSFSAQAAALSLGFGDELIDIDKQILATLGRIEKKPRGEGLRAT